MSVDRVDLDPAQGVEGPTDEGVDRLEPRCRSVDDAQDEGAALVQPLRELVEVGQRRVDGSSGEPRPAGQVEPAPRGTAVHHRARRKGQQVFDEFGAVDAAVAGEPARGGDLALRHGQECRFVDLELDRGGRDAPGQLLGECGNALGQGASQFTSGPMVGQQPVARGSLNRRGQRPGTGHGHLERALEALKQLLRVVEVGAPLGTGASVVGVGVLGESPAGGLEVERKVADQPERPADHRGAHASLGEFWKRQDLG